MPSIECFAARIETLSVLYDLPVTMQVRYVTSFVLIFIPLLFSLNFSLIYLAFDPPYSSCTSSSRPPPPLLFLRPSSQRPFLFHFLFMFPLFFPLSSHFISILADPLQATMVSPRISLQGSVSLIVLLRVLSTHWTRKDMEFNEWLSSTLTYITAAVQRT